MVTVRSTSIATFHAGASRLAARQRRFDPRDVSMTLEPGSLRSGDYGGMTGRPSHAAHIFDPSTAAPMSRMRPARHCDSDDDVVQGLAVVS